MTVREKTRVLARTAPEGQRTGPHWWGLVGAGAAVVLVGLLLALFTVGGTDSAPTGATAPGNGTDGAAGAADSGARPEARFPRTERGAVDAAVAYLGALADPAMLQAEHRQAVLREIVDPAVAADLLPDFDAAFGTVAQRLQLDGDGEPAGGALVSRNGLIALDRAFR